MLSKERKNQTSILDSTIKLETPDEAELIWEKQPEISPDTTLEQKGIEKTEVKLENENNNLENELLINATSILNKKPGSMRKENILKNLRQAVTSKYKRKTKTQSGKFQCGQRLQFYSSASSLRFHRVVHTGERQHACPHCKLRFARKADLRGHIRIHTGERPYECIYCSKKFLRADVLSKHLHIHNGDSLLKCPHCPAKFVKPGNFDRHMVNHGNSQFNDGEDMETERQAP